MSDLIVIKGLPHPVSIRSQAVRVVVALAAAAAFAVPLLVSLHARVPATRHAALFEPKPGDRLVPLDIGGYLGSAGTTVIEIHRARLAVQDVASLTSHQRILLMVATFGTAPRVRSAELSFAGMACVYRSANDIDVADNYLVVFERDAGCEPANGQASGDATLTFRLTNRARLALAAFISDAPPPRGALVVVSSGVADARGSPILQGATVDVVPGEAATRIELLNYMWRLRRSGGWLDAAIALSGLLVGCAVLIAWPARRSPRLATARDAVAAFLAALALSGAYAVLCPPLQVADEPSHFLALTTYIGRPLLGDQAQAWARRGMFEEIRFDPRRPFSPLDRGRLGRPWSEISVPLRDVYGGVRALWSALGPLIRGMDPAPAFLTVRLFHATCFALAVALFVLLVRRFAGGAALTAVLPLVLIPTLPQFGMHVSNYAPLLCAYAVLGAGVVIALWDGPDSWAAGPILGLGLGLAIGISRSSLPLLPFVAAILAARALLGDRAARRPAALAFWGGCTALLACALLFIQSSYVDELDVYGRLVASRAAAITLLLRHPALVLPLGAAGLAIELLLTRARRMLAFSSHPAAVRAIAAAAASGMLVLCAASLVVPYPTLPLYVAAQRPSSSEYVSSAVLACATFLRMGRPDWLTSVTFFAGFGWLDMIPPTRLVSLLAGGSGLMLVLLLGWVARARAARTLVWLGCAGAGFVASAAAYALSMIRAVPSDLHGRYLIGLYLCALVVCWTGPGRAAASSPSDRSSVLAGAALACAIAVNVYSLRLILLRYFS